MSNIISGQHKGMLQRLSILALLQQYDLDFNTIKAELKTTGDSLSGAIVQLKEKELIFAIIDDDGTTVYRLTEAGYDMLSSLDEL